jgi:hypothetical protein
VVNGRGARGEFDSWLCLGRWVAVES